VGSREWESGRVGERERGRGGERDGYQMILVSLPLSLSLFTELI